MAASEASAQRGQGDPSSCPQRVSRPMLSPTPVEMPPRWNLGKPMVNWKTTRWKLVSGARIQPWPPSCTDGMTSGSDKIPVSEANNHFLSREDVVGPDPLCLRGQLRTLERDAFMEYLGLVGYIWLYLKHIGLYWAPAVYQPFISLFVYCLNSLGEHSGQFSEQLLGICGPVVLEMVCLAVSRGDHLLTQGLEQADSPFSTPNFSWVKWT